ncbi:COP1-interactive protein 1-like [Centruroides sculpturatus]|uniref:COP1-interactive protein 1-like n=1 Tax=Centruroides sculpturatus TaxID=218467 RepID=UPI000C6E95A1|nr:COP1-interactive protein 1-like [Centruroides sculpturatus]
MTIQTLPLPELVELALSTPDAGMVNFQILKTVLHILIKEVGLEKLCAKVNLVDIKPQKFQMPELPRRSSEIVESISLDLADRAESEVLNQINSVEAASEMASQNNFKDTVKTPRNVCTYLTAKYKDSREDAESNSTKDSSDLESSSELSTSIKDKKLVENDINDFWKAMSLNSRVTALEDGLEKIVDIIDENVRDVQHFKKDIKRRCEKDNESKVLLQLNFDKLYQSQNEIVEKVQYFVMKENFEELRDAHLQNTNEIYNLIQSADERFNVLSKKLEGDYKMSDILFDISEIRTILKVPRKKAKSSTLSPCKLNSEIAPEMSHAMENATEFEEFKTRLQNTEEKIEKLEESNREMLKNREEEIMSYEEKMAAKEEVLNKLISFMANSKEKIINVEELLTAYDERITKLKEAIVEIAKIQDNMAEEGKKNVFDIKNKLEKTFMELEKFSLIEEIHTHLEDIKMNKADRFEMFDGLDRKCDRTQVEDKLDKSIYEYHYEKLISDISNLKTKLADQEEEVVNAFKNLSDLMEDKFERKEMEIFQVNLKEQLQLLASKLRHLKRTVEERPLAAGIKIRCVSCDSPVQRKTNVVISDPNNNKKIPQYSESKRCDVSIREIEKLILPVKEGFKISFVYHCLGETELSKTVFSEGDELLDRIIIGDDTWVSHMTPESKQQSMEW